jgi:hypothetical protein
MMPKVFRAFMVLGLSSLSTMSANSATAQDRYFYYATPDGHFLHLRPSHKRNHIHGSLIVGGAAVSGEFKKVEPRRYVFSNLPSSFEDGCRIFLTERQEGTVFDVEVDQDTACSVSGKDLSGVFIKNFRLAPGPDHGNF